MSSADLDAQSILRDAVYELLPYDWTFSLQGLPGGWHGVITPATRGEEPWECSALPDGPTTVDGALMDVLATVLLIRQEHPDELEAGAT